MNTSFILSAINLLAADTQQPSFLGNPLIMVGLFIVMMYFVIIRPNQQQRKQIEKMLSELKVGDHVILSGGEHGTLTSIKEKTVIIRLAENLKVEYEKSAITSVTKKSSIVEATVSSN
jgi:preprotein translocase subunit YajC